MTVIDKEGEKALKVLEKSRKQELKKLEEAFTKEQEEITGKLQDKNRLDGVKFWSKSKGEEKATDPRYWVLANVNSLQNFVKYGANKVMDQIRVRTHANIMAREEIERIKNEKKGFDGKQFAFTVIIMVIAAAMAYIVISNFFNFQTVQSDNIELSKKIGTLEGELAKCNVQLSGYIPGAVVEPPAEENTLEG